MKNLFFSVLCVLLLLLNSCKKELGNIIKNQEKKQVITRESNFLAPSNWYPYIKTGDDFPAYLVALSYDDGPDKYSSQLSSYLYSENVSATFFVTYINRVGAGANKALWGGFYPYPILQNYILQNQRIGNHTICHNDVTIDGTAPIHELQTLINPWNYNNYYLFRAPYYDWPAIQPQVLSIHGDSVHPYCIMSNLNNFNGKDVEDWINPLYIPANIKADSMLQAIEWNTIYQDHGGILLMHDRNEFDLNTTYALDETRELVPQLKNAGYIFAPTTLYFSDKQNFTNAGGDFSDADGWGSNVGYYGTIRLADVNNDGRDDICARASAGIVVALSNLSGFDSKTYWKTDDFRDNQTWYAPDGTLKSWRDPEYSTTIQFADVTGDGKPDLVIRGPNGIEVARNTGSGFGQTEFWSSLNQYGIYDFSDADGWGSHDYYYGTIRLADVNGDGLADVCARASGGIVVALSDGSKFKPLTYWKTDDFRDDQGWDDPKYSLTIQFADVIGNSGASIGDRLPDVVARGYNGMVVAKNINGTSFGSTENWSSWNGQYWDFSDADGWGSNVGYYGTMRLADVNCDGVPDLCARSMNGMVVAFGDPVLHKFLRKTIWTPNNYGDSQGWLDPKYSLPTLFGDINGDHRADLVTRWSTGLVGGFAP
jgi:hypothetical protein